MHHEVLNHPLISQRYFFPLHGQFPDPFWIDCGDAQLACYYQQFYEQGKTLLHFHGNGEIVDDWLGVFPDFCKNVGCNLLLVEYRGYGQSTGEPELGKMLDDVGRLIAAVDLPAQQLIVMGRSVGSIFALEAVSRAPDVAGLIIESGIADVLERLLLRVTPGDLGVSAEQLQWVVNESLNQGRKMGAYQGPVLVLHTQNDDIVAVEHGRRLYEWASGAKTLKIFPHGSHNDIMLANHREYFQLIEDFLVSLT